MGRGKIKMELIKNEKARMITYNKRKKGLIKKVEEFQILCNVDACLIILGPKCKNLPTDVEAWPSDNNEVMRIINRYRSQGGERRRTHDLSTYFEARQKKVEDDIAKIHRACLKAKFPLWDNRLNQFQVQQLRALDCTLESKIEVAMDRILSIRGESNNNYCMMIGSNYSGSFGNALINHKQQSSNFSGLNPFDCQMIQYNVNPMNMMMLNNPRAHPVRWQDPPLMLPSVSSQIRIPQFSDFFAADELQISDDKGNFGY